MEAIKDNKEASGLNSGSGLEGMDGPTGLTGPTGPTGLTGSDSGSGSDSGLGSGSARKAETYRVTIIGSVWNALLLVFKFVAGIVGHSSAMIADAVHSLSDFVTDIIVLVFVKISSKPSDETHDYGHGKFETLATVIISLMLFGVGAGIMWSSGVKIWNYMHGEELEAPGSIALIAAVISLVVKEGLYHYTIRIARKLDSRVVEANAWHHRSDAFSSVGTALGIAGAMFFGVNGRVLDPIAAEIVSVLIMRAAYKMLIPSIDELLDKSLTADEEQKIYDIIEHHPEAESPHNLRTRRIGNAKAVEVHVRMSPNMTVGHSHEITRELEREIRKALGHDTLVTIHVEPIK